MHQSTLPLKQNHSRLRCFTEELCTYYIPKGTIFKTVVTKMKLSVFQQMLFSLYANTLKSLIFNDKNKTFMNKYIVLSLPSEVEILISIRLLCFKSCIMGHGMTIVIIWSFNLFHHHLKINSQVEYSHIFNCSCTELCGRSQSLFLGYFISTWF